jgi:hypothetical protein
MLHFIRNNMTHSNLTKKQEIIKILDNILEQSYDLCEHTDKSVAEKSYKINNLAYDLKSKLEKYQLN